jgi:hypothetical protein
MACRGSGRVISNLGGTPSTVECPWCTGTGLRPAEIDAQAHWGLEGAPAGEAPTAEQRSAAVSEAPAVEGEPATGEAGQPGLEPDPPDAA